VLPEALPPSATRLRIPVSRKTPAAERRNQQASYYVESRFRVFCVAAARRPLSLRADATSFRSMCFSERPTGLERIGFAISCVLAFSFKRGNGGTVGVLTAWLFFLGGGLQRYDLGKFARVVMAGGNHRRRSNKGQARGNVDAGVVGPDQGRRAS
jgi:hypothetical protein